MTESLVRDSATPLYVQFEEILRGKISSGDWRPGERIPSENQLNRMYGLSRMTARGVLTKLVEEGVLFRVPGKGTYVAEHKIRAVSPAYQGIREQLEAMGYETSTQLLGIERELPGSSVRDRLKLSASDAVHAIRRLRSVQDQPISLHHSFVPAALAPGLEDQDVTSEQLCVVLEKHYGLSMTRVEEQLEATSASQEQADHLRIPPGSPILSLEHTIHDSTGRPFEHSKIIFRGDKIRLHFDYDL